ncbi:SpoVK/Ycf46/Vps4 family AAA+-type ATPase [Pseudomonas otitidis]|nr:AAA family ATPase [Pseudomonas otitidis]MCP1618694.1 SpoVK/Ycf46/Vps4 family AAA+-type ATPase [Pseudomonas otitidis]
MDVLHGAKRGEQGIQLIVIEVGQLPFLELHRLHRGQRVRDGLTTTTPATSREKKIRAGKTLRVSAMSVLVAPAQPASDRANRAKKGGDVRQLAKPSRQKPNKEHAKKRKAFTHLAFLLTKTDRSMTFHRNTALSRRAFSFEVTMQVEYADIIALIEASLEANYSDVRSVSNRIAKTVSQQDVEAAKQIKSILRRKGVPLRSSGYMESLPVDPKSRMPLLEEHQWPVSPLFLNQEAKEIFETYITDVVNLDRLLRNGLGGRMNMLLSGPPGTGKTLIAGHLAAQLNRPLYVVRLDSVISSLLGDTAKNLRQIFEFVPAKNGVLFLDEVDAVAKLRDDKHEIGELKRVVNTLIQGLDSLDDHTIVIAATNHSGLLDPAIWRRFPYKIRFELPDTSIRKNLWDHFLFQDKGEEEVTTLLAKLSEGLTGADIESISIAARRKSVLSESPINLGSVIKAVTSSTSGNTSMPTNSEIGSSDKKEIAHLLHNKHSVSKVEISKLLNISRQTIASYLKE